MHYVFHLLILEVVVTNVLAKGGSLLVWAPAITHVDYVSQILCVSEHFSQHWHAQIIHGVLNSSAQGCLQLEQKNNHAVWPRGSSNWGSPYSY